MVAWPASLPQAPEAIAFNEVFADNTVRFQPAIGPPKTRQRATQNTSRFNVQFILDATQTTTFSTFYRDTIDNGALKFDFTDPITSTTKEYRFASPPTLRHIGYTNYRLQAVFIRLPD